MVSIESGESHSDLSSATSDHGASSALHASITGAHPLVSITEVQSESMIIEGGQTTLKNVTITESTRLSSIGSEEYSDEQLILIE